MTFLTACATTSTGRDVAAVVTSPTAEGRAELRRVVSQALKGAPVTIADDALTRDSTLIIEHARLRGANGVPLSGREMGRPEHFQLVKNGARCVLVHERTGKRFKLKSVSCAPRPSQPHAGPSPDSMMGRMSMPSTVPQSWSEMITSWETSTSRRVR
jgi:hypothetical protein